MSESGRREANLRDMARRGKIINEIINEYLTGRTEITDAEMRELTRLVAPHKKNFTEYEW
jgi:hypothetical protein